MINAILERTAVVSVPDKYAEYMKVVEAGELSPYSFELLKKINDEFDVLPEERVSALKPWIEKILADEALTYFLNLMRVAAADMEIFPTIVRDIQFDSEKDKDLLSATELCLFFAVFELVPFSINSYRKRGVPDEYIRKNLPSFEGSLQANIDKLGRYGFTVHNVFWNWHQIECKILQVGRLNFEMRDDFPGRVYVYENAAGDTVIFPHDRKFHRDGITLGSYGYEDEEGSFEATVTETEDSVTGYVTREDGRCENRTITLSKSEWKCMIRPGDKYISVHIPAGSGLTPESVAESYEKARNEFPSYFPEFEPKAFICFSWLMDPALSDLLGEHTNIAQFGKTFKRFTIGSDGRDPFIFVFTKHSDVRDHYEQLPQNTTLERKLRELYMDGGAILDFGGYRKW